MTFFFFIKFNLDFPISLFKYFHQSTTYLLAYITWPLVCKPVQSTAWGSLWEMFVLLQVTVSQKFSPYNYLQSQWMPYIHSGLLFPVTSAISHLINLFVIFQDSHLLQYCILHLIDCLGRSLWKHACCFVVIFLACLKTQSCWHISFRLSVFKKKNITLFSEVSIWFPSLPFLLSGKYTLVSCFSHSFSHSFSCSAVEYALKYVLIELILSF